MWPEQRLVLEVDGYSYHGHRAKFEHDRRKDMALHGRRLPRDSRHLAPAHGASRSPSLR